MNDITFIFFSIYTKIKPIIEILILWIVFYRILFFFQGTRAFQVLKGITYLLIAFLVSQIFVLDTLNWLLTKLFAISVIAVLIIFQPELRQGLARLGQQHLFNIDLAESELLLIIEQIVQSVQKLSRQRTGCLIAIERETQLKTSVESGVGMDGKVSAEIIQCIFSFASPLHDGGIIIRGERIVAAACLFPLSENPHLSKSTGTRHRAAMGLSEQTDCIVVMVSEETGSISVAADGSFIAIKDKEDLTRTLTEFLIKRANTKHEPKRTYS